MRAKFDFDVVQLIQLVKDKPCIWDRLEESYKDKVERKIAWDEIIAALDPSYEEKTPEQKRMTGDHIITKWTNVRDTFIRSLKPSMGKPKKKYIYYSHLKFLTKNYPEEECNVTEDYVDSEIENIPSSRKRKKHRHTYADKPPASPTCEESENDEEPTIAAKIEMDEEDYPADYLNRWTTGQDSTDFISLNGAPAIASSEIKTRLMNEDEAFFASLLPTVVKYNEDERLEFRIEVLNVMRKIKEKRQSSLV